MMYNSNFKYDLKIGQVGEKYLADILQNKKIEVKTDFKASKTGNLFVEYESRNKPSGISVTESEWYAFIVSNDIIKLITVSELKRKCRKLIGTNRDILGGDNNTSKGVLIKVSDI